MHDTTPDKIATNDSSHDGHLSRLVSYDQRGCGASSWDGSFDVHDQVADLDALRNF